MKKKDRLKVSIVLTTYNGMEYIEEQLDSIKNQTYHADEVLIFDDGSTDCTCDYVQQYIIKNNLDWQLKINEKNLGWQRNFIEGIKKTKGEIVFLADQDDVWHTQKIEIMLDEIEQNESIDLLVCSYKKVFANDDYNIKEYDVLLSKSKKLLCDYSNTGIVYPGCTYCFRKAFFNKIESAWVDMFPHDALLYIAAWLADSIYVCEETLHFFRRHANSASLRGVDLSISHRCERVSRLLSVVKAIELDKKICVINKYATDYINWLQMRYDLLANRKISAGLKILRYYKFYPSFKTWGVDMYLVLKSRLFRGENN